MKYLLLLALLWTAGPARAQLRLHDAEAVTAAATRGDTAELTALLDAGGPIDGRNAHGWTPLMCALAEQETEAAKILLARHANPNLLSLKGASPLDFAVGYNCTEIIPLLLDAGAEANGFRSGGINGENASPMFLAVQRHNLDALKFLVAHGARLEDTSNQGNTVLMEACRRRYPDQVAFLIAQGAKVNARGAHGYTALIYAAYNGDEESVRLLLAHGADLHVSGDGSSGGRIGPWEAASEQGQPYVLEALAEAGATAADPRLALNDELYNALSVGDYERAQAALARGASAKEPDKHGVMPLMVAAVVGDPGTVQMLLKAGADVNAISRGDQSMTALSSVEYQITHAKTPAEREKFQKVAALLQKAGAAR